LPGYQSDAWYALLAPAKTPRPVIERLNQEVVGLIKLPEIRESLLQQGAEPVGSSPGELRDLIKADIDKWSRVVKAAGIKLE
jgi:tripartite-type tricarboxylate transporter receptor subunit TctC